MRDVEHKWLEHDGNAPFIETRRTPDIENMDPEQYRQSISQLVLAFVSVNITIRITKSIVMLKCCLLQYEQQPERDSSRYTAFGEPAESDSAAAPDVAAPETDAATASATAESQSAAHASTCTENIISRRVTLSAISL